MNVMWLGISTIRDGGAQMRVQMNEEHIERLVEALQSGAELPPIVVFHYAGEEAYWLADGYHRYEAHKRLNREVIRAEVRPGDRRDALLYAAGANATHGLPRTRADVRRAIAALLRDEEWQRWSDREIARRVGCHHSTVAAVRREMEASGEISQMSERLVERDGVTYTIKSRDPYEIEAERWLVRAQNCGATDSMRLYLLNQAKSVIAQITDQSVRTELENRARVLRDEADQARRQNDEQWLAEAREWMQFAERESDDNERRRYVDRAQQALWRVYNRQTAEWQELHRRSVALQTQQPPARLVTPAPGERPEITEIRRRAAALGYHTALTGAPGQDHILIWRTGERLSDLDGLPLDEARTWLDEREAEARAWLEERKAEASAGSDLAAYQERVGALLADADIRLLRLLGVIFGRGDETDVEIIAQEMVSVALQSDPDRLYRILAQVKGELELRYHP